MIYGAWLWSEGSCSGPFLYTGRQCRGPWAGQSPVRVNCDIRIPSRKRYLQAYRIFISQHGGGGAYSMHHPSITRRQATYTSRSLKTSARQGHISTSQQGCFPAACQMEMTRPLEGTPDALVSESNSVKTKALLWCVGATAGSRMMSTNVPTMCHTVEAPFQSARKRVGRKLMRACRNRMTAAPTADQHHAIS